MSGDLHSQFVWSRFAVRTMLLFLCTVALCLLNFTSYPASQSWPTDSRLLFRSPKTCAFLACSFSIGRFSFAVLHYRIVLLFGMRTMRGGLFSLVILQGALLVMKWLVHPLSRIAIFAWAVM
jgi:hypothetical protein